MNLSSISLIVLLVGSMVYYGTSHETTRRSWPLAIKKTRQGPSEIGIAAEPLSLDEKRSTSNGKTLDENFAVHVLGRRKRQAFLDMFGDPSLMFNQHLSEYGTFNQETYACDEVRSRRCERPSDCDGCLGLFTCQMPQGRCDFKSVSRRTGIFYQSLQKEETSDGNSQ